MPDISKSRLDLLTYFYDRADGRGEHDVKALAVAPFNFKIGLLNNVDLQIVALPYNFLWTHDRDSTARRERRALATSFFGAK